MNALHTYVFINVSGLRSSTMFFHDRADSVHDTMLYTIVTSLWQAHAQCHASPPNQLCYAYTLILKA